MLKNLNQFFVATILVVTSAQVMSYDMWVNNKSELTIDVYVANKDSKYKNVTYTSPRDYTANDSNIANVLQRITPNNSANIHYNQDPKAVVVRFYNPNDPNHILLTIDVPLDNSDRTAQIYVEGNDYPTADGKKNWDSLSELSLWANPDDGKNYNRPVANSVTLFSNGNNTWKKTYFAGGNTERLRIATAPSPQ